MARASKKAFVEAHRNFQCERMIEGKVPVSLPKPPPIEEIENFLEMDESKRKFPYFKMPDDPSDSLMAREWKRRKEGLWFFCGPNDNINLEYVTGYHYMLLQHFPLKRPDGSVGNAFFIDAQRDVYYVWQEVEKSKTHAGLLLLSARRFSKTTIACSIGIEKVISGPERDMGIQSMTKYDSEVTVYDKIILRSWENMHPVWKPEATVTTTSLSFKTKKARQSKGKSATFGGGIETFTAKTNAMDGREFHYVYHDEIGKPETGVNPKERYYVVLPTLFVGDIRRGTCMLTTTVDDMDKEAAIETKELWDQSNIKDIDERTGTTPSKLLRLFIPADYGRAGFYNEWGYSDRDRAKENIMNERAVRKGSDLISWRRKFPLDEKDIFLQNVEQSPFDVSSIVSQIEFNSAGADRIIRRVTFYRDPGTGGQGPVKFREDKKGAWFIRDFPRQEDQNCHRPMPEDRSQLEPTRKFFKMGVDPFGKSDIIQKSRGSMGAALILDINHRWVAMYYGRPPKIEIFANQMILAAQFFSCECLIEDNKAFLVEEFRRRGFEGYMMYNPLERNHRLKFKKRGINTKGEKREELVQILGSEVYDYIGYNEETGTYGDCIFNQLLEEMLIFDPSNWTPYDLTVAAMLAATAWKDQRIDPMDEFRDLGLSKIPKFNLRGKGVGRRIR